MNEGLMQQVEAQERLQAEISRLLGFIRAAIRDGADPTEILDGIFGCILDSTPNQRVARMVMERISREIAADRSLHGQSGA